MINFARFLHEEGVPWSAIHHEVLLSHWMFEAPHSALDGNWGEPTNGRAKIESDVAKIDRHPAAGACHRGYVTPLRGMLLRGL